MLQNHIEAVRKEYEASEKTVKREATIYSVIVEKYAMGGKSDGMLDFFNQLFISLNNNLSEPEKKLASSMISNVLSNVSKDYLNFIGELASLNYYKTQLHYQLLNVEEKIVMNSNVSADFLFKTPNNTDVLIEILNIHLEDMELTDMGKVKYHIDSKINNKIKAKILTNDREIFIQPVLWLRDQKSYELANELYLKNPLTNLNAKEPLVYCTLKDTSGQFEHRFESIYTIMRP